MSVVSKNVEDVYTSKDIPCIKELEESFETSLLDLLHNKFIPEFVDIDYPVVKIKNFHRRKLVHVNNIGLIKQLIRKRLGRIAPKVFFVKFGIKDYPIDNFNIDKALVVLFFMICGCSQREIGKGKHNLIDATGFGKILKQFLTDELDQWCDKVLAECFSNATTRLLYAYIHNPEMEQTCTMSFDGHDQRINYRAALKNPKVKFYSYKHKKCAYRTQVCCDIFDFVLGISSSKGCAMKNSADILMMKVFDFKLFLANTDCCYMDGAYKYGIQEIVDKLNTITNQEDDEEITINRSDELLSDDEIDLDDENEFKKKHLDCDSDTESSIDYSTDSEDSDNSKTDQPFIPANFLTPVRKTRGKKFKGSEKFYNKSFGGKRSHIESKFARHGKMFKQFSHCSAMSLEPSTYNRLLKLSHVLHNIKQMEILFAEYLDIPIDNDQWMSEMFDYPTKKQLKRISISTKKNLKRGSK